ncbi:MAG: prephenate dehydrogenase [Natrialbaceae archaeon]|nr:prephenate dehydrogenase [Natrialbaceae archaeon]
MDVLIVGAGAMGRWFGATIDADVAYADVDRDAATAAADHTGGRVAGMEGGPDDHDVVCLAVPMQSVVPAIQAQADRARAGLVDLSGVMAAPLEAMAAAAPTLEHLSIHPLFAPDRAPGSVPYVEAAGGTHTTAILQALEQAGNELVETTAAEHDRAMETVQAASHAAILAFSLAAEDVPDGLETPVYDDLRSLARRVTGGTSRVYADIQGTYAGAATVASEADRIAGAETAEEFEALYREATAHWHASRGGEE